MKKLCVNYFLVLLMGLGVLSSCNKAEDLVTPAPTIELVNPPAEQQEAGAVIKFTIEAEASENIEEITILEKIGSTSKTVDGYPKTKDFKTKTSDLIVFEYTVPATTETIELTFRVKDKNGKEGSDSHTIKAAAAETALGAATAFEWKRIGSNAATGLEEFGLAWTSNTSTSAVIKVGAAKLVVLTANDWTAITTVEALKAKVDAATGVDSYTGVSATVASKTYNDVLATKNGDNYYLINVTKSTVASATAGTTITITGNSKK